MLTPLLVGLWASYIDFKLFKKQKRLKKRLYYQYVTVITIFGLLINFFTPVFFSIDFDTNTYQRGYLFFLRYILIFLLYFHVAYMTLKNRNRQNSHIIIGIMTFLLFPIIGAIIQIFFQTLYFQFSGSALGVLVIFIFLETTSGNKDYLTNLYSRRVLDEYLDGLVEKQESFTVIMIDLDHFKEINDEFGHHAGDQVLIEFSRILLKLKKAKRSIISRLGGDEFLCILAEEDSKQYTTYLQQLEKQSNSSVILKTYGFKGFSEGALVYDHQMDVDNLLKNVDSLMYSKKNSKR
jgi:diguanylate cyclase (GGDEF)-like protein